MQHNIDSAKTNSTKPWMWFKIRTCAEETGQPQASYKKPQNMPSWKGPPRIAEYKPWPCTGHSNNPTLSLRALSKCSLSSGSLGAVTTRWGACSSAWPSSGGRTCSYYPSPCSRTSPDSTGQGQLPPHTALCPSGQAANPGRHQSPA